MMQIQSKHVEPGIVVLEVTGRITLGRDSKQLEWTTENLVRENHRKIILDLTGVTQIDSTGIGIIMTSAAQLKNAGGELRLAGASGHVEHVLRTTSVDKVIALHPDAAAATSGF
jgi:anti-sigma B factor antagonist